MRWVIAIPVLALVTGTGLLAFWALGGLMEALSGRTRRLLVMGRQRQQRAEELYGLPGDMTIWMVVCAVVGVGMTMAMMTGPARFVGVIAAVIPVLWRRWALEIARHRTRQELLEILEILHLSLTFGGSLTGALLDIAEEEGKGRSRIVRDRILANQQTLILQGPEEFLEKLAGELRLAELRRLLRRVRASRLGGTSYEDALRDAIADVRQEIWYRAEMDVEGAPIRLLLPMVFTLLPTALVLLLYPLAAVLRAMLAGAGSGGFPFP